MLDPIRGDRPEISPSVRRRNSPHRHGRQTMISRPTFRLALGIGLALVPSLAMAHAGGPHVHGLLDGFIHPFSGFDHLTAMLAVGVIAAQRGGRALWLVPTSF